MWWTRFLPSPDKEVMKLGRVERIATRMAVELRGIGYECQLPETGLFSVAYLMTYGDLIYATRTTRGDLGLDL